MSFFHFRGHIQKIWAKLEKRRHARTHDVISAPSPSCPVHAHNHPFAVPGPCLWTIPTQKYHFFCFKGFKCKKDEKSMLLFQQQKNRVGFIEKNAFFDERLGFFGHSQKHIVGVKTWKNYRKKLPCTIPVIFHILAMKTTQNLRNKVKCKM